MMTTEQPASVAPTKISLRRLIAGRLRGIDARTRTTWDDAVAARILDSDAFRLAPSIVGYFALSDEVNIDRVLAAAVERNKPAFVPVVRGELMVFARWTPRSLVQRSDRGTLQATAERVDVCEIGACLVLVPGRVFDSEGERVGRGGGHYDRAFASPVRGVRLAGVGYELQIVDAVPVATHDRKVEMVFTEQRCVSCR
ncbi:MAG: 5-formyltetrahydrofolate cyclo-ligase [Deltaproteobacteria bacterium]|nr:5-formyltetrahydrofolate cyclo-ligase [Deltaproteobacteria bacterium]